MESENKDIGGAKEEIQNESEETVEGALEAADIEVQHLRRALEEEKNRADAYLSKWRRSQADFANYKRRTEQERDEATKFANAMLILNLLPVLDDMERALDCVSPKLSSLTWIDGICRIHHKFQTILETNGLTQIRAEGELFDPKLHEALAHAEGDEGRVIEELQKGYRLYGRTIRPTLVKVGVKSEEATKELEEKKDLQ